MEFIINNWYLIVAVIALGISGCILIFRYINTPKPEQLQKVSEWLLYAVIEAERQFGSGTGQLKLRWVYDLFVSRFSWLAKVIPFDKFSQMVDEALIDMRKLLETNSAVKSLVNNVPYSLLRSK